MFTLQNFVFPNLDISASPELYLRTTDREAMCRLKEGGIRFAENGTAYFDTYFNGLTVQAWKRLDINDLTFVISGQGTFLLRFGLHRFGHSHRWLEEQEIEIAEGEHAEIDLPFWTKLEQGMLYVAVTALSEGLMAAASFATQMPVRQPVRLGVVITHFNRKDAVALAINRFRRNIVDGQKGESQIQLVVVDNSQNLLPEETRGATLIPNRNLGGSGGFTRGLMHLEDEGSFTHCLFMDDDASCEIESIRRVYALLSYATEPRFAVAGALLRQVESHRLFEKGARFDGLCRPLKSGLDMRNVEHLLLSEREDEKVQYGGWWLFAFALKDVEHYPFPFFVRGDDVTFSLTNEFSIFTMNGIASWGDDFALKSSPLNHYLDGRYHCFLQLAVLRQRKRRISKWMKKFFISHLWSYTYASASAFNLAIDHIQEDNEFWRKNIGLREIRDFISTLQPSEKHVRLKRSDYAVVYPGREKRTRLQRWLRRITKNGALMPGLFLKKKVVFQHKSFQANPDDVYGYKQIYYEYDLTGEGFVASFNAARHFEELKRFRTLRRRFIKDFDKIRDQQIEALNKYSRRSFWEAIYASGTPDPGTSRSP